MQGQYIFNDKNSFTVKEKYTVLCCFLYHGNGTWIHSLNTWPGPVANYSFLYQCMYYQSADLLLIYTEVEPENSSDPIVYLI